MHFSILGWTIIAGAVLVTSVGGIFLGRYATEVSTFLVGGRKVRKFLLTSSGQATEVGIIAVVMMAQEGYVNGPVALSFTIVTMVTLLATGLTGFCVYGLRKSRAVTLGEYAQIRFGSRKFRMFAGIPLLIAGVSTIAMFPPVLGTFFTSFMGWPAETHILGLTVGTPALIGGIFVAAIVAYTLAAASTGLVFADFFQYFVIWLGLVAIGVYAVQDTSWTRIVGVFSAQGGADAFSTIKSSSYGIGWILFMVLQCLYGAIVWPPAVSRILSSRAPKVSKQFYVLTSFMQPGRIAILTFMGLAAATAITAAQLPPADEVLLGAPSLTAMPMYIATILPPIWLAVFVAAILCAEISTLDGYILAWSGVMTHDIVLPWYKRELTEREKVRANKLFVVAIGVMIYLWGLFFTLSETLLTYIMLCAATYTAGAAAFLTCGLYWKRANATGAWCAMLMGMALPIVSVVTTGFLGQQFLAMKWVGTLSYVLAFIGMVVGSLLGERIYGKAEAVRFASEESAHEVEARMEV